MPSDGAYFPTLQALHSLDSILLVTNPAAHFEQFSARDNENIPGLQLVQLITPPRE
jgi:hypothetical protein